MKNHSCRVTLFLCAVLALFVSVTCGRKGPDAPPDLIAPTVTATDPAYGAQEVPVSVGSITATFSETMSGSSINDETVYLKAGDATVTGTLSYSGGKAVFTPAAQLNPNTTYTITVTTGVKDLAGNAMVSPFFSTFTTGGPSSGTYTVTPSAGPHGSLQPGSPQTVSSNAAVTFTANPDNGYRVESVSGCGGSLSGSTYTTGPITADCTVTAVFSANATVNHTITATAGPNGTISPSGAVTVPDGATKTFTVAPATGYAVSSVSGCGGSLSGSTYTTGPITADCAVTASFSATGPVTHIVAASAASHGKITPSGAIVVVDGGTAMFTITPDKGYELVTPVGGTCRGTLSGKIYSVTGIRADCTVTASFARTQSTVTPSPGPNGTLSPSEPQLVYFEETTSFTVTPAGLYTIGSVTGCAGTLTGSIFTTGPVIADCTVNATFASATLTVTPSTGANGTITPGTPQLVSYNAVITFVVAADAGYSIASVTGCGGSLAGGIYTTAPVIADCAVAASFSGTILTATPAPVENGAIEPSAPQQVGYNGQAVFTVTPAEGYSISSVTGCGGTLAGSVYTTGPITADCTVTAVFGAMIAI